MVGNVLVVGGTRGLGYELARLFASTQSVLVAGRTADSIDSRIGYVPVDLAKVKSVHKLVASLPPIDTLVMAAGYAQFGYLDTLSFSDVEHMVQVGLLSPMLLTLYLLKQQKILPNYIHITSTSQWTPRANEPIYAASKAGIGRFAESMAGDPKVGRVLVAGPSGMKTAFWDGQSNDTSLFLEPAAVAEAIYTDWCSVKDYQFREIAILRNPLRVEVRNVR